MNQNLIAIIVFLAIAIIAYLLGSINFAIIFTRIFKKTDIRDYGSGNAGFTNVARTAGKLPAILTFVCDLSKGIAAVLLSALLIKNISIFGYNGVIDPLYAEYIAGFCCFMGHIYPIYYGFRGGKGVVTLLSIYLVFNPKIALICFGIFLIIFFISRIVSLSSVLSIGLAPLFAVIFPNQTVASQQFLVPQYEFEIAMAALFALIIVLKHIPNIKRLIKGEEKRMSFKKSK